MRIDGTWRGRRLSVETPGGPLSAWAATNHETCASAGVRLVERARARLRQPEEDLIETAVSRCQARLPGTAVFLASAPNGVPLALTQFTSTIVCCTSACCSPPW